MLCQKVSMMIFRTERCCKCTTGFACMHAFDLTQMLLSEEVQIARERVWSSRNKQDFGAKQPAATTEWHARESGRVLCMSECWCSMTRLVEI
jgi:hypothetical protein